VIQETLLDDPQLQPVVAVTLTFPLPPAALNDAPVEESVYVQLLGVVAHASSDLAEVLPALS
jgi:hypothetical protein